MKLRIIDKPMIGPQKKKMPDRLICLGCDVLVSKQLGGTELYPKQWTVYYCNHLDLCTEVAFIKRGVPYTPKWCPAIKGIEK